MNDKLLKTIFEIDNIKSELFQAYYDARKNKRNTLNALDFEVNLEQNILELYQEIIEYRYQLRPSICFIVEKPVKREIFAAHFRDRVVHHFIINKLIHIFENQFIYDSYSCRKGKGTHFGIKRIDHFIRSCSNNYTKDCYILKLDIQGFFMNINRALLLKKVSILINKKYELDDKPMLQYLIEQVLMNDVIQNCIIKGQKSDWSDLPKTKSLFHSPKNCGLPIGNLTSQIFANYYLNEFDYFVKTDLKMRYYGRYVDDFIIIQENKTVLKLLIPIIKSYLYENLGLTLHPKKIYLQHFKKGVAYLGTIILPHRIYIGNRTKRNFYESLKQFTIHNSQFNIISYIGIMQHYKTNKVISDGFRGERSWENLGMINDQ